MMPLLEYLNLILVGVDQLFPIGVGLILWIGLAGIGVLVTGKNSPTEANVVFGWAVVSTVFTLVGVVARSPFLALTVTAWVAALAGIFVAWKRGQPLFVPGMWRILVLALPIFLIAGAMDPSQWDEFSHWLPAPGYLLEFDGFPNAEIPNAGIPMLSAYPFGWPILSYLAGRIGGFQLLNIGGILNLLLLLTFTPFALKLVMRIFGRQLEQPIGWGMAAVCGLTATILNPTFVQKIVLTAYSGVSTSVVTGFSVLLCYRFLDDLDDRNRSNPWPAAWQLSLAFMLLINLRQPNLVLFLALIMALVFITLRAPELSSKQLAKFLPLIILPALIVYFSWRIYVGSELSAVPGAEAKLRSFGDWNLSELPQIFIQMAVVAGKKIGFFGTMLIVSVFAIIGFFRMRSGLDRLLIFCAAIFTGYNAFLIFTYVAHFSAPSALRVVSYWRYNTQIGTVAIVCILIGSLYLWNRYLGFEKRFQWLAGLAIVLVVGLPILFAPKLRFDLEPPKPHYTSVAKDLRDDGIASGRLFLMDPNGTGEAAVMSRFYLRNGGEAWLSAHSDPTPAKVREYLRRLKNNDLLLIHSISDGLKDELAYPLNPRRSYIFKRTENTWKLLKEWPKPANHPY